MGLFSGIGGILGGVLGGPLGSNLGGALGGGLLGNLDAQQRQQAGLQERVDWIASQRNMSPQERASLLDCAAQQQAGPIDRRVQQQLADMANAGLFGPKPWKVYNPTRREWVDPVRLFPVEPTPRDFAREAEAELELLCPEGHAGAALARAPWYRRLWIWSLKLVLRFLPT